MAIFYLIRHGQPDYGPCDALGYPGFGRDLAPLTALGVRQAEMAAEDQRLRGADLIVSSPYTRAMQTAAIISSRTGIPLTVEVGLHEWLPDLTYRYCTSQEAARRAQEFSNCRGILPVDSPMAWESLESMRKRVRAVADKYADRECVVLVGHGMALRTLAYIEQMQPGQIVVCTYEAGQPDCPYYFG
jgi:broad specificity phosphatase PhoE